MISVTVSGRIDNNILKNIFESNVQDVTYVRFNKAGNVEAFSIAGTNYFLRTNDTIGFALFSFYDGSDQRIDFGRIGGGSGLLNIRLGAGNKIEDKILRGIKESAEDAGVSVSES